MRLLITGGLGLIGRGVLRALAASNPEIRVRILDGRQASLPNTEIIHGDVCDPDCVYQAVAGCDMVLHLAGHLGVENTENDYLTCLETNVIGTRSVLDACFRNRVRRVVLASSSEVYGSVSGELSEATQVHPKSVYAVAKLAGEKYALAYHQRYGLDARAIRFFNVYGPWQRGDFVVRRFLENLRQGRAPEVFGSGTQVRCFCHVDDAARGALAVLLTENLSERVFNIGNDREPIEMRELARRMIAVSGLPLEPVLVPFHNSDRSATREIEHRVPSVRLAAEVLGYEPRVTLDDGLRRLFAGDPAEPQERPPLANASMQTPRIWRSGHAVPSQERTP